MKYKFKVLNNLIAIEGIDGSGKTTILNHLKEKLLYSNDEAIRGKMIETTKEPYDKEITKRIRSLLSPEESIDREYRYLTLLHLYMADKYIHQNDILADIFEDNEKFFVTDRSIISTFAYQHLDFPLDHLYNLSKPLCIPKYVVYLDIPVATALTRMKDRGIVNDMYERQDILTKVKHNYETILKKLRSDNKDFNYVEINAEMNDFDLFSKVYKIIYKTIDYELDDKKIFKFKAFR
jgi:dTMP kinase